MKTKVINPKSRNISKRAKPNYGDVSTIQLNIIDAMAKISHGSKAEAEIRYLDNSSTVGIHRSTFMRLFNKLSAASHKSGQKIEVFRFTETILEEGKDKDKNAYKIRSRQYEDGQMVYERKTELLRTLLPFNEKVVLSKEFEIDEFKASPIRTNFVERFEFKSSEFTIHLSSSTSQKNNRTVYFVEMEFSPTKFVEANEYSKSYLLKLIQDTDIIYTRDDYIKLVRSFNQLTDSRYPSSKSMDTSTLVKPRNLHMEDMKYGGIVGNKDVEYVATHKVDGVRKVLIVAAGGIWFVHPPYSAKKIESIQEGSGDGYVVDGELLDEKIPGVNTKYVYIPSDMISTPHKTNIKFDRYYDDKGTSSRIAAIVILKRFLSELERRGRLTIVMKQFVILRYNTILGKLRDLIDSKPSYKTDGLIFVPANTPYMPTIEQTIRGKNVIIPMSEVDIKKRVLSKYPDLCKYKQVVTTDFLVSYTPEGYVTLNVLTKKGEEKRKAFLPFQPKEGYKISDEIRNYSDGQIVEFRYENGMMIPIRLRDDRIFPNKLSVAVDNWKLMINPISIDTMKGIDYGFMTDYHRNIRKKIFESLSDGYSETPTILLLGAGKDINLIDLGKFSKIFILESSKSTIKTIKSKITSATGYAVELGKEYSTVTSVKEVKRTTRFYFVKANIAQVELIRSIINSATGRVDCIASCWDMSKYYKDEETFNNFVSLINGSLSPNGQFGFFSINGRAVVNYYHPKTTIAQGVRYTSPRILNQKTGMIAVEGSTIKIKFLNQGVKQYYGGGLVDINLLASKLGKKLINVRWATDETLMSEGEFEISKLMCYGYITSKENVSIKPYVKEKKDTTFSIVISGTDGRLSSTKNRSDPRTTIRKRFEKPKPPKVVRKFKPYVELVDPLPVKSKTDRFATRVVGRNRKIALISCIDNGSSLIHCLCNAIYPAYRDMSYEEKISFALDLRADIAQRIVDSNNKRIKDELKSLSSTEKGTESTKGKDIYDVINSENHIPTKYYRIISYVLNVGIEIINVTVSGKVSPLLIVGEKMNNKIVLSGNEDGPFDLVGKVIKGEAQTVMNKRGHLDL